MLRSSNLPPAIRAHGEAQDGMSIDEPHRDATLTFVNRRAEFSG
jgi:hypothetical protein